LFHIQIVCTLYEDSLQNLEKQDTWLNNKVKGRRIDLSPLYLRQEEGYKSTLPIGEMFIKDKLRNFNTGALTACFPFYNSEISHKDGVFLGINLATATPVLLDFYDRGILNNSNITVFGQAGAGKSYFLSTLTLRSALRGIRTVFIDPEGEYRPLTEKMGGAYIKLAPNVAMGLNPFDIEEELDEDTGRMKVDIKSKIADNLNLIAVMVGGLDNEAKAVVSMILRQMYDERGFTENPESLMSEEVTFNPITGEMIHNARKAMPTLSDFHRLLDSYAKKTENTAIQKLSNSLRMFVKGGIYDLFDRQTSEGLTGLFEKPIITFDVSQLEEGILRPIGMYIALSWTWEKFIKKTPDIKKRIICDEAWMLVNKNMQGSEFTASFLENCSRRIRKRNGGLLVASQNFMEFADNAQGKAVLTNAMCNIFLSQSSTDIEGIKETFRLSDGERDFLLTAKRGEMLLRCKGESSVVRVHTFAAEHDMITNKNSRK
jgi:type IV secretory pathway VirB4 component